MFQLNLCDFLAGPAGPSVRSEADVSSNPRASGQRCARPSPARTKGPGWGASGLRPSLAPAVALATLGVQAFGPWSRDVVRETTKKSNMVSVNVFILSFGPFLLSEGILFISFFSGLVHFMLMPFCEALFLPDATELTYANTLLLSSAAVSLGSAYSTRENLILFPASVGASVAGPALAWAFLSLQIKEFRNLGFYLSDSVYGCIFFILEGLHFLHVIVGLMLLGIYSNFPETFDCIYLIVCQDLYFSIHLFYWHFVEVIWLLLYYFLYLSY